MRKWNKQFPGFNQNPKQWRERWRNHLDPRINKDPWKPEEELIFIEKHKIYGNKWAEIAKFLDGRNDNSVKNYFYSSVRKIIRKISMKRVTYDLKENEIERELTIYLSQYIYEMYKDYLEHKKKEKSETTIKITNANDGNGDYSMEANEESKNERTSTLKTGDKYIIRKLVSLKISPAQIQDFIGMLTSSSEGLNSANWYQASSFVGYAPNVNQMGYNNQYMTVPENSNMQQRSNSWYDNNRNMQFNGIQNMPVMDDSQLIQRFGQFNLVNQNMQYMQAQNTIEQYQLPQQNYSNSNEMSLDNNYSNNENPLSSLPLHLQTKAKPTRPHSTNRVPESSTYMKESFLFDKLTSENSKDDNTIQKVQNPLKVEKQEVRSFAPRVLKYNMPEVDNLSSPSRSSQSSVFSFNDAGSWSSLDLSFDGSGNPYLKPFRASAFAKVQTGDNSDRSSSLSADDRKNYENQEIEKGLLIEMEENNDDESKFQNKSSFYRLKDSSGEEINADDTPKTN